MVCLFVCFVFFNFLGDLFDMLLPMLSIYNEYVRNHHYSLQVLAECKQNPALNQLLKQYEAKPVCEGRSMETFLTYPMHQVRTNMHSYHNHIQVLAECKQNPALNQLLKQYEAKPVCEGRSMETFLTYPMHQVRTNMHSFIPYFLYNSAPLSKT